MAVIKPKTPVHFTGGYTSGPTPVADFIVKVWQGIVIAIVTPLGLFALAMMPAYFLIQGLGNFIGLTPAWAELVHASASFGVTIPFMGMLLQNLAAGVVVTLILSIPLVRRCIKNHRVREIAKSVGTSTAVAAFELSLGALALYALLGVLIAVAISALGLILPVPGGYDTVVASATFMFNGLEGSGGGWPPPADQISMFATLMLAFLLLVGMVLGASSWALFWGLGKAAASAGASEAAGGGASALGALLALAVTGGRDTSLGYGSFWEAVWRGVGHGALSGALLALILLAGAAVLGVG